MMNYPNTDTARKILIADDDRVNQQLISFQLAGLQYNLLFASDGQEALELFAENRDVELVLMDVKMPGMNGLEATRKILELEPMAKIIALSAFTREENDFDAAEVGFIDYVSKPIRKEELLKVVAQYLD